VTFPFLQASGISVRRGERLTLGPSDFTLRAGETVGIYGPNGAGKSTLLQALADLHPLSSGTLKVCGQLLGQDRRIAAVFQEPLLLRGTVAHNVGLGLALRGVGRAEREARVQPVLHQLKIAHLADRPIGMLSGGEAQRTSLARAIVLNSEALYLDEPFAALDQPTRRRFVREFAELLLSRRMATVFVTHDFAEAAALCTAVPFSMQARSSRMRRHFNCSNGREPGGSRRLSASRMLGMLDRTGADLRHR
jgi:tungstate transport system ATP-binding protein